MLGGEAEKHIFSEYVTQKKLKDSLPFFFSYYHEKEPEIPNWWLYSLKFSAPAHIQHILTSPESTNQNMMIELFQLKTKSTCVSK